MVKKAVVTDKAPGAIGAYSQGIVYQNLVFTSGQLPMDPATGMMVSGDVAEQARQALANVKAVLEEAGSSLSRVVKVTIFLADISHFGAVNEVYKEFFEAQDAAFPARSVVQAAALPKPDALLEIEAIGVR